MEEVSSYYSSVDHNPTLHICIFPWNEFFISQQRLRLKILDAAFVTRKHEEQPHDIFGAAEEGDRGAHSSAECEVCCDWCRQMDTDLWLVETEYWPLIGAGAWSCCTSPSRRVCRQPRSWRGSASSCSARRRGWGRCGRASSRATATSAACPACSAPWWRLWAASSPQGPACPGPAVRREEDKPRPQLQLTPAPLPPPLGAVLLLLVQVGGALPRPPAVCRGWVWALRWMYSWMRTSAPCPPP